MPTNLDDKLVVAISSRALFDFEEENAVFDEGDPVRYQKLQLERLDQPADRGRRLPAGRRSCWRSTRPRSRRSRS